MEEGQKDVEGWVGIHATDLSWVRVDQDRIARVLNGVDGYLTGAVAGQALEMETHVGMEPQEEGAVEVLETVGHSTILCAGVSGRVAHCPSYRSHTHDSGGHSRRGYERQSSAAACYRLRANTTWWRIICAGRGDPTDVLTCWVMCSM
jgi:hypothetical protein